MPLWETVTIGSIIAVLSAFGYAHSVAIAEHQSEMEYFEKLQRIREEKNELIIQRSQSMVESRLNK